MSIRHSDHFKEVVENIFNRWSALKLAVEHGMGGSGGLDTAIEIMEYVTNYCLKNNDLDSHEIKELLEDIMDQEFNTICEDDSTNEISMHLMRFLQMFREERLPDVAAELAKLPPCVMWIKKGGKITYAPVAEDSDDNSFDYDESVSHNVEGPSTSGSTTQMMEEDVEIEPGWTVVRGKR